MRRTIGILLLSLAAVTVKAQAGSRDTISFATTVGTGISMSTPSSTPFSWQVLGYYNLTERWALGVGTGLSFYEKTLIPLFGDVKFQIGRTRKFTPYVECGVGYSFAPSREAHGGFFMNPSFGIQYPLKHKMKLQFAVGYETQDMKRLKKQTDAYFLKQFEEELGHQSITVKLGLSF